MNREKSPYKVNFRLRVHHKEKAKNKPDQLSASLTEMSLSTMILISQFVFCFLFMEQATCNQLQMSVCGAELVKICTNIAIVKYFISDYCKLKKVINTATVLSI